jgi:alcohol dehydrogenase (cytochrome c)
MGPPILGRLPRLDDRRVISLIHNGIPGRGMPPSGLDEPTVASLVSYLRSIQNRAEVIATRKVNMVGGGTLEGDILGEGFDDLQLRTADKRVHLLRRSGDQYREVTSQVGWPNYNGDTGGNRFTTLPQITKDNVSRLAPKWVFTVPNAGRLQLTPVVVDGIMYVTAPNQCYALDAGTGRQIWHFETPRQEGMTTAGGSNRGVAVAGNRVFLDTDRAHIIALDRMTGDLLWESEIADWRQNYYAQSAPLTAGNLVITGVGGGEHGANGSVVAFDQATGKEV